jgi:PAS domain-containing protein
MVLRRKGSRPVFTVFLGKVLGGQAGLSCDVALARDGAPGADEAGRIWVRIEATASGDGRECALAAVDITALKESEEALRRSEDRYRSIFENTVVGIFQSVPDGRRHSRHR